MTAHPFPALLAAAEALKPDCLLLTEIAPPTRRLSLGDKLALGALAAAATALGWSLYLAASVDTSVEIALAPAMPEDLIAATRGAQASIVATGQRAQAINAALPFSTAPIEAAQPFTLGGTPAVTRATALHCLTQAVYYEAAYEPLEGRRAVAQVVLNRVRHPAFPNSVCGVVYDGASRATGCQFSFTCDGSLRRRPSQAAWAEAERVAREALSGQVASTIGLATHYHANYVAPYWAPRLTKLRQIGAHIFYRWPGAWGRTAAFSSRYAGIEAIALPPSADQEEAVTDLAALSPDPTDRRAPEDVGGRLDVTKGWTLTIPSPDESRGRLAGVLNRQAPAASPAAVPAVSSNSESGVQ